VKLNDSLWQPVIRTATGSTESPGHGRLRWPARAETA
jgi:hypothetical protein